MKIRNYIYALVAVMMISVTSCKDQFELDLLNNPNAVTQENADIELYFNAIQLNFNSFMYGVNRLSTPTVRMRVLGGIQYNSFYGATSFNGTWSNAYASLFPDMDALTDLATAESGFVWTGATKVMRAWTLFALVDFFGDIPYSEAGLGVAVPSPIADGQVAVYTAAFNMLDDAIADLTNPASIGKPASDLFYDGDADSWVALANTLKMRYHLTTRLAGGSGAAFQAIVTSGDYIAARGDNFAFSYSTNQFNPNSRHPWYNQHYNAPTAGGDYMSNDYMFKFLRDADPRLRYYFYRQNLNPGGVDAFTLGCPAELKPDHYTNDMPFCLATLDHADPNSSLGYWGRDHGNGDGIPPDGDKRTNYGIYPAAGVFDADQGVPQKHNGIDGALGAGINPFMMSYYVDFMRAEAALTMGTGDNARTLLEAGMRESIDYTMDFASNLGDGGGQLAPSNIAIDNYVNAKLALYDAAADDQARLDIVMDEYQRASHGSGLEAFNGYRRTGFPSGLQLTENLDGGDFPRCMFYPGNYVDLNENAVQRALTDQVFWDTNPPGFIN